MKFLMKNSLDIFRKVERSFRVIDYVKVLFLLERKKNHEIFRGFILGRIVSIENILLFYVTNFKFLKDLFDKKSLSMRQSINTT